MARWGQGQVFETEIWSIYRGLTIILEKGLTNIQIETDSQTSVVLFNEGANPNHPRVTFYMMVDTFSIGLAAHSRTSTGEQMNVLTSLQDLELNILRT